MSVPPPRATYRLQLRPGFGFAEAAAIAGYLAELGISHVYASPVLQAAPGSLHGYDVADPGRISEELGGEEGFTAMVDALHAAGLGLLLDIVPNHMSTDARVNPWWADVLEAGIESPYAGHFDIDWDPPQPELRDRVLLAVLGDSLEAVAGRGELRLERAAGRVRLAYFEARIPLAPVTLGGLLAAAAARPGGEPLAAPAGAARRGFGGGEPGLAARRRWWEGLAAATPPGSDAAAALDAELGTVSADPTEVLGLCDRQHWLLAHWRDAAERLNYRRFFTIGGLAGVRVEEPRVFDDVHAVIARLVREGRVDGLRVDHVDGLREPARYLERLREATGAGWVVVEKILERDEELPDAWAADGTTGYELGALLTEISVDPAGATPLSDLHAGLTGHTESFEHCVHQARVEVLYGDLRCDVTRLAARLERVVDGAGLDPPVAPAEAHEALAAVVAELGVYRSYVDPESGRCPPWDAAEVGIAVTRARRRLVGVRDDLLDLIADCLCGHFSGAGLGLAASVQQLSPAVMAKGKEDSALYRWNRLLALNEVGADPTAFGLEVADFHAACRRWAERGDAGLRATSTHDTKRSEDVRARLCVLSEIPDRWAAAVRAWSAASASYRPALLDPDTEYVLFQTLVGAHPIDAARLTDYLAKATREAGLHTSWTAPDPAYDAAVRDFAVAVLGDRELMAGVDAFVAPLAAWGRRLSLAWTLLKLTVPGVPDVYQGTELWDLSLVDPDNRRPVDFEERRRLLARLDSAEATPAVEGGGDGLVKLRLLHRGLQVRRECEEAFAPGAAYTPLTAAGPHAGRLVAFARGRPAAAVIVADRRATDPAGGWRGTTVTLPPGRWVDRLSLAEQHVLEGEVSAVELLAELPGALLVAG